ncbi:MAG TPA: class I SAM-dependent methyltransferase [Candidatus Acidoferrales bacterium]|jgi:ubiquinone/menaquinone biosynthesis C-methylase UbiE|nr:class I SAM-dependent methyltransferase [Candidatus Acidoferrales bacterium]
MSKSSHSSGHHHHDHHPHDWDSSKYVSRWAEGQDKKENDRQEPFQVLAETIPYDKKLPIRILDVGAGYGALTQFLLNYFPKATAICQDGSKEMAKLGQERMKQLKGRFDYVLCDFSKSGWTETLTGPFEAVVSSIAIHNVSPKIIERIYSDIFPLVKSGGCFINFDRERPPLEEQFQWLKEAGFQNVERFWRRGNRSLFGGFKK